MARRRKREFWIGEVQPHWRKWRFRIVSPGFSGFRTYETEALARKANKAYKEKAASEGVRDIEEALAKFEAYSLDSNELGNKARSVDTKMGRLRNFFPERERCNSLERLSEEKITALYSEMKQHYAVDTHRKALSMVKTFLNYCVDRKWISKNPAAKVKGTGKRKKGKPQLNIDEVRRFVDSALYLCRERKLHSNDLWRPRYGRPVQYGIAGPAAALTTFLLGLRADEVASRLVRDLDDDGRLLNVVGAKSEAGERSQEVPDLLQPYLKQLTENKSPNDKLFGGQRQWVTTWVKKVCRLAGVPVVCAHSMRGLHTTICVRRGTTAHVIVEAIGHSEFRTTKDHYIQPGTVEQANQDRVLSIVQGGRK